MRKTSVYLPDGLKRQLSALAERTHRSEADLLRTAVEQLVAGAHAPQPAGDPAVAGRLVGVGVGPGAADLLTGRALHALRRATRIVAPCTDLAAVGRAEAIVREAAPDVTVERVVFAMVRDEDARQAALAAVAEHVAALLDEGHEVAFITLGDPNLYSTFSSVAAGVAARRPGTTVETVPGIMAFQELAARAGAVLADDQQSFLVLPANEAPVSGTDGDLAGALADPARTVVVYKGGRQIDTVVERLRDADRLEDAVFGELLGMPGERIAPAGDVAGRPASYFSAVIAPARSGT